MSIKTIVFCLSGFRSRKFGSNLILEINKIKSLDRYSDNLNIFCADSISLMFIRKTGLRDIKLI